MARALATTSAEQAAIISIPASAVIGDEVRRTGGREPAAALEAVSVARAAEGTG